ncbi:MAG: transcription elongation factor GreA [Xanthomonadaceae bacterium]|nr:transcription elongation factor GreA [Xanthomonadaceae bacterium]MDE2053232.1 transcription elongation factor GreA [Xanthomonadaceae bacterium]MDE2223863.1 transcription elongation factor GreA [Xanthomonadaceae bacterium]MDE2497198.1 transcription elongation factor GreA [Xanthomonadaceae bacterium]
MQRAPMTRTGSERLRAELEQLKSVDRPRVIAAIAEARAHGDLKENAEYHAAREQQGFIEGRIGQIEAALSTAQIIDPATLNAGGKVVFGAVVELEDSDNGSSVTYQIVGDLEADIKKNMIAVSSPIARAMIGKNEGDSFGFNAPGGERNYEIVSVRYA